MEGDDGARKRNVEDFCGQDHHQQDGRDDKAILVNGVINKNPGPGSDRNRDEDEEQRVNASAERKSTHGRNSPECVSRVNLDWPVPGSMRSMIADLPNVRPITTYVPNLVGKIAETTKRGFGVQATQRGTVESSYQPAK